MRWTLVPDDESFNHHESAGRATGTDQNWK